MQFNPYRTGFTPSGPNVSVSDLLNANEAVNAGLKGITGGLQKFGQQDRSEALRRKLLEAKTAEDMLKARGEGSLTDQAQLDFDKMLKTAQEAEAAKQEQQYQTGERIAEQENAAKVAELLNLNKAKSDKAAMEHDINLEGIRNQNQLGLQDLRGRQQMAVQELAGKQADKRASRAATGKLTPAQELAQYEEKKKIDAKYRKPDKANQSITQKALETAAVNDFISNPKSSEKKALAVQEVMDKNNLFFDAELDDTSKGVLEQLAYDGLDTKEGQKAMASKNPEAMKTYFDKILAKNGLYLDEGTFGKITIKKR